MVIIKIEEKEYPIPSDLNDLDLETFFLCFQLFEDGKLEDLYCHFVPREIIEGCSSQIVDYLTQLLTSLFKSAMIENGEVECYTKPELIEEYGILFSPLESLTYGQFLDWKHYFTTLSYWESLVYTATLLKHGPYDYSERAEHLDYSLPVSFCIFLQKKYSTQFAELQKKYGTLFDEQGPEDIQIRAGVERLNGYGSYNSVYSLAQGNILNIDKVVEKTVGEVYLFLSYEKTYFEYQKKLGELKADELRRNYKTN